MKADERVGLLYDFAVSKPEGFTYLDVHREYGWHRTNFGRTVRALRLLFSGDAITLTCDRAAWNMPHVYKLVGNYEAARPWVAGRVGDLESRLDTVHAVANTLTNATDGRTLEGRKVRRIKKTIGRLIEDLNEIKNDGGGAA